MEGSVRESALEQAGLRFEDLFGCQLAQIIDRVGLYMLREFVVNTCRPRLGGDEAWRAALHDGSMEQAIGLRADEEPVVGRLLVAEWLKIEPAEGIQPVLKGHYDDVALFGALAPCPC